jgi:hypothetical protein
VSFLRFAAAKLAASIHTTAGSHCDDDIPSTRSARMADIPAVMTKMRAASTGSGPRPLSPRSSASGRGAVASTAASSPSTAAQSPLPNPSRYRLRWAAWITSELRWPASDMRRRSDAAARTCMSKVESGASPATAAASPSSSTHASSRGVSWSSFTISRRRRAVERQCTRRRLSPTWCSRMLCRS